MSDLPGSSAGPPTADSPASAAPPGWHPDPLGRYDHRWFDGTAWTSQVSTDGRPTTDPYGTAPSPAGAPPRQALGYPTGDGPGGRKNGIAIAAMVCGIISILTAWIPFVVAAGLVLAVLGLVFGIVGLRRSADGGRGRGQAIAGIVTGGIGLALSVLGIILTVLFWQAISDFIEPGPHELVVESCVSDGRIATATGTLTNESASTRSYTLFVEIDDGSSVVTVDDVGAGDTVDWRVGVNTRDAAAADCDPDVNVNGPFPFGIEIDPVER